MRSERVALDSIDVILHLPGYACVVNKPYDLRIDGDVPCSAEKLLEKEMKRLEPEQFVTPTEGFGIRLVHQLDFATSGVLCFALCKAAAAELHALFSHRSAKKTYLALVWGHMTEDCYVFSTPIYEPPGDGIRVSLGTPEHPGRCAVTHAYVGYRALYASKPVTYVVLRPTTGRRHQLRVHLASAGFPIVGDLNYCDDKSSPRMMLHAWALVLPRPSHSLSVRTQDPFRALLSDSIPSKALSQSAAGIGEAEFALLRELPEYQKDFAMAGVLPYCYISGEVHFLLSTQPRREWIPLKAKKEEANASSDSNVDLRKRQKLDTEVVDNLDEGKLLSAKGTNLACFTTTRSESEVDSFLCAARALFNETMFSFCSKIESELRADQHAVMLFADKLRAGNGCIALKFRSQSLLSTQTSATLAPNARIKSKVVKTSLWPRVVVYAAPVHFVEADQITSRLALFHSASKAKRKELAGVSHQPGSKSFSWISANNLFAEQKDASAHQVQFDPLLSRLRACTQFQEMIKVLRPGQSLLETRASSHVVSSGVVSDEVPQSFFSKADCVRLCEQAIQAASIDYAVLDVQ